jgi:ADP-heptose:LPS heptosyltransferase
MRPRIIVSRTDRIGDVVLTLPLCGLLAEELGAEVMFLGRGYTTPVLEACAAVGKILDWDSVGSAGDDAQAAFLRDTGADTILHVWPRPDIARAARRAGIRRRIGTTHRLYHWWTCNALVCLGRRGSDLHEAQLNVRLAGTLLRGTDYTLSDLAAFGRLTPRVPVPERATRLIAPDRINIAFQVKTRGSSREWPLERWRELIRLLDGSRYRIGVIGTAEERELIAELLVDPPPHVVDMTGLDLRELIATLARMDGIVSCSTGPLQVGAALSIHALGLVPPTRPIHPGRYAPLGARAEYVTPPAQCDACVAGREPCTCMSAISARDVADRVSRWSRLSRA